MEMLNHFIDHFMDLLTACWPVETCRTSMPYALLQWRRLRKQSYQLSSILLREMEESEENFSFQPDGE